MAKYIPFDRIFLDDKDISGICRDYIISGGVDMPRTVTITMYADRIETDEEGNMTIRLTIR